MLAGQEGLDFVKDYLSLIVKKVDYYGCIRGK
jgi:hypothetical protein